MMPRSGTVLVNAYRPAVVVPSVWKSPHIGSTRYMPTCVKSGIVSGSGHTRMQNLAQRRAQIQWHSWMQKGCSFSSSTIARKVFAPPAPTASLSRRSSTGLAAS